MEKNSTKAGYELISGNKGIEDICTSTKLEADIKKVAPVEVNEAEISEANKELGLGNYDRVRTKLLLTLSKAVDYLKVRFN